MKTYYKKETLPTFLADFYKTSHRVQYPEGTEVVFSNWIPRTSRIPGVTKVVSFGQQGMAREWLMDAFNVNFFDRPKDEVIAEYEEFMSCTLGPQYADSQHIADLHDLGYLPVEIRIVEEGRLVPIGVPMVTVINTDPNFFWVTNYIETLVSCEMWMPMTSATLAYEYRKILDKYAIMTTGSTEGVQFQGHDFSMRGMAGVGAAKLSGMGHLLSFVGTDTMPAITDLVWKYDADYTKELVGCSVPATEHSVECANCEGTLEGEYEHTKRLITEIYPSGIVSKVSDTFDLWAVITEVLPRLKDEIMSRDGKLVIRPDSGDPVKILCGDPEAEGPAKKGVVELLWDIFGGTMTRQGYKVLDEHIGAIYGDRITIERCRQICKQLEEKGFASINIVLGIGSFTYQYNTRDTFGFAMKSTYAVVDGNERLLFKDPITDNGTKKSLKGLCIVYDGNDGDIKVRDGFNAKEYMDGLNNDIMKTIYENGEMKNETTLSEIRTKLLS